MCLSTLGYVWLAKISHVKNSHILAMSRAELSMDLRRRSRSNLSLWRMATSFRATTHDSDNEVGIIAAGWKPTERDLVFHRVEVNRPRYGSAAAGEIPDVIGYRTVEGGTGRGWGIGYRFVGRFHRRRHRWSVTVRAAVSVSRCGTGHLSATAVTSDNWSQQPVRRIRVMPLVNDVKCSYGTMIQLWCSRCTLRIFGWPQTFSFFTAFPYMQPLRLFYALWDIIVCNIERAIAVICPSVSLSVSHIVCKLLCIPHTHTGDLLANHIKHKVEKYEKEC